MKRWHKPADPLPAPLLRAFADAIAVRLGLHFPEEHGGDLARALRGMSGEAGGGDARIFLETLLAVPWEAQALASLARHLTNGETWFFREPAVFDALRQLLTEVRRRGRLRLRIWSAGCSSGEEPWSIAMTLAEALPDLAQWDVRILATDINPAALEKAGRGVYRPWSFRACPAHFRDTYFQPAGNGCHAVGARLRSLVSFMPHNLAADAFPPMGGLMDVIFCRNVLMYFRPDMGRRLADRLGACLADEGWLVTGAAEAGIPASSVLQPLRLPELVLFRKPSGEAPPPLARAPWPGVAAGIVATPDVQGTLALATELANRGQLDAALVCCGRALCRDRLDLAATYLQAAIFAEQGRLPEAVAAFRRTLYIDPAHRLAHVSLGHLLARQGRRREALRHVRNALSLIQDLAPDEALADAEGMRVGELRASMERLAAGLGAA